MKQKSEKTTLKNVLKFCVVNAFIAILLPANAVVAQTLTEGITHLENENFGAARQVFNKIIKQEPANADAYYYLGETYYADEKPDSAKIFFVQGTTAAPKGAAPHIGLGKLLLDQKKPADAKKSFDQALKLSKSKDARIFALVGKAYTESSQKNADLAIEHALKATELDAKKSEHFVALGDAYLAKNDGGNAMTNYERARDKDPKNPRGYMKIARLWVRAQQLDQAAQALEKCIEMENTYAPAYKQLIEVYSSQKKTSKITPLLKRYLELQGDDLAARVRYVKYLFYTVKDYETANIEADKVLAAEPKNIWATRVKGYIQYEQEKYTESYATLQKLIEIAPKEKLYATDYEYIAKAAGKNGQPDKASEYYQKIPELDSTRTDIYETIAKTYYDAKNYDQAAKYYKLKMKSQKPNAQDFYYLGRCYYSQKQYNRADSVFTELTKAFPKLPTGYTWRGRCNEALDANYSMGLAKSHYETTIQLATDPNNVKDPSKYKRDLIDAYSYLGYYHSNKGDLAQAKANFMKVIELDPADKNANDALQKIGN